MSVFKKEKMLKEYNPFKKVVYLGGFLSVYLDTGALTHVHMGGYGHK